MLDCQNCLHHLSLTRCDDLVLAQQSETFLKAAWLCLLVFLADGCLFFVDWFQVVWQKMSEPLVHVAPWDRGPKCLV